MEYNLPKGYLSYSSMQLWKGAKDQFRRKYYSDEAYDFNTAYTQFGKEIAETLEDEALTAEHPILSQIPSYDIPEYPVEHTIEGVPIKGYIDSFCPYGFKILEYKTGIRAKNGKPAWSHLKVRRHEQLLLYSLLIKEMHGYVDPTVTLVWMETKWGEHCTETYFNDKAFTKCGPQLELTGHFKTFDRTIEDWEHLKMKQEIVRIATEISEDYTHYKQTVDN